MALWGSSFVATRIALESFHPFGLVALRLPLGVLVLAFLARHRGEKLLPAPADRAACTALGLVLGAHMLIQSFGLLFTSAINTGWIIAFMPLTIAVGSRLVFHERLRSAAWGGLGLGLIGVMLVSLSAPPEFEKARLGDALQLVSCLTWTVYTLAAVKPVAGSGALRVTASAMLVGAAVLLVVAAAAGFTRGPLTIRAALAVAYLGLACSGLAFYSWFAAIEQSGTTPIASLLYLEPFFALATAVALLHEPVEALALLGGLVVLLGVWLVSRGAVPAA